MVLILQAVVLLQELALELPLVMTSVLALVWICVSIVTLVPIEIDSDTHDEADSVIDYDIDIAEGNAVGPSKTSQPKENH